MSAVKARHGGKYKNNQITKFYPQHPEKCKNSTVIECKSRLELLCCLYLDKNDAIISWSYEGKFIYYFNKLIGKRSRYFIDFIAVAKIGNALTKTLWIEVKSKQETLMPKNKNDLEAMKTYAINQAKWEAARTLAKSQNASFVILTEEQLY